LWRGPRPWRPWYGHLDAASLVGAIIRDELFGRSPQQLCFFSLSLSFPTSSFLTTLRKRARLGLWRVTFMIDIFCVPTWPSPFHDLLAEAPDDEQAREIIPRSSVCMPWRRKRPYFVRPSIGRRRRSHSDTTSHRPCAHAPRIEASIPPLPQQLTMMFSRARPRSRRCDTPPSDGTRACDAITARDAAPNAEWQYSILSPTSPPGHDRRAQARAWPDNVPHNHMLIKYIGLVFNPHENGSDRAQFVTRAFTLIKR
jgi:hypothetical protein